jgi:transposase
MKVQEVILHVMAKKLTWWQAAEVLGLSDWEMGRWRKRYENYGYDGLYIRRRSRLMPRRVPMETVEKVLQLYREKYFDLNVQQFHEKLVEEHQLQLSYTWVKLVLEGAGLIAQERQTSARRSKARRSLASPGFEQGRTINVSV